MWPNVQLSNLLPNAGLKILESCGHWPWLDKPESLRGAIFDWFDARLQ